MRGGCLRFVARPVESSRTGVFGPVKGTTAAEHVCHRPKPQSPVKPSSSLPMTDSSLVELTSNRGIRIPTICVTYRNLRQRAAHFRSLEQLVFFGGIFTALKEEGKEGWTEGTFRLIILSLTEPADIARRHKANYIRTAEDPLSVIYYEHQTNYFCQLDF